MEFFTSAVSTLQTLVVALGAGLAVWGVINLLEGYGSDNPGANGAGFKKAKEIAERIRIAVMNKSFHYKEQLIKLMCSFGVCTIDDFLIPPTIDEMIDIVDKRLYEAKNSGRNIVVP